MADYGIDEKSKKVFDFLSTINQTAYKDIYLLSNEILSKNPFSNNFVEKLLCGEIVESPSIFTIFSNWLMYYLRSFVYFGIYMSFFAAFRISRLQHAATPSAGELILIDTFFLVDKIKKDEHYEDPYFIGLREVLEKLGKHYAYLPVFTTNKNPASFFNIFRLLKKDKVPVLTEYQLLSGRDLLKIFYFILIYPIKVSLFARNIKGDSYETELLKSELIKDLKKTTFLKYSRYLQGKKIFLLPYEKIKLISWYENQAIDKNLYRGIREGGDRVKIYGAQPFIASKSILNILTDENETRFGIVPDKIVVNGSYFIPENTGMDFVVGPSFRYKKIFSVAINEKNKNNILILLPYFKDDAKNILDILANANIPVQNIIIKAHPSTPVETFRDMIPVNAKTTASDLYKLFKTAKIVIGAASGTLIESASLGIPVIFIKKTRGIEYNPLPDYGRSIIWEDVTNAAELAEVVVRFESMLKDNDSLSKMKKIADEYKRMFFCEPTEENIIRVYELV